MSTVILVQRNYSFCNGQVYLLSTVISHHKKDIKSWHQWRWQSYVGLEVLGLIITTHDGVHGCKNGASCIKSSLYTSFCNRDCLLLHGFMNGNRISFLHLVKLINAANTVVCKHKGSCFKSEVSCLRILGQRGGQTSCWGTLAWCVDCSWDVVVNKLQELRLCSRRVANKTNVYVTSDLHSINSLFIDTTKQH